MRRRRGERRKKRQTIGRRGAATRYQLRRKLLSIGDDLHIMNEAGKRVLEIVIFMTDDSGFSNAVG
jgi:hypothetical protein